MGGCRCSYKTCTSVTTPDKAVHFFHYPVKAPDVCSHWIKNAEKPHFKQLSEDQLRNKVVCEYHFESKCFPNFQKKRLLRGAIPTLDGPAVTKQKPQSAVPRMPPLTPRLPPGTTARLATPAPQQTWNAEGPKIELLSANDDATLFVLDTSSIEFPVTPKIEVVESYIYENGSLLPSKDLENIEDTVMELSEIEDKQQNEIIYQDQHKGINDPNKMEGKKVYPFLYSENSTDEFEYPLTRKSVSPTPPQNSITGSKHISSEYGSHVVGNKLKSSEELPIKYMQKIKENSRDIASIKKFIRNNTCIRRTFHNRSTLLRGVRRFVPPSLYSVLKMNLGSNKILSPDLKFFLSIYEKSPEVYNMLSKEYKWNLPDIRDLKALKGNQQK